MSTNAVAAPPASRAAGADVSVRHVVKRYPGGVEALRDVSLEVPPGQFAVLTGPSGCGKTTLLNVIGSLDRPDSGEVIVDGTCVSRLVHPFEFRRSTVGFVFQLHHLLPMLSAEGNVEVPLIAAGVRPAERRRRAQEVLAEVGLGDRTHRLPGELSGGERQRVAIARALANRPRLVLADEPTGSLDTEAGGRILGLLDELRHLEGTTLIVASHDPAVAERADRVIAMRDGQVEGQIR